MKNKVRTILVIGIAVAIVMLFAVVGLAGCELNTPTLAEYQATAIAALEDYAASKGQSNYTPENWLVLQGHVAAGIEAINDTTNKADVCTARDEAKAAVRAVPKNGGSSVDIEALKEQIRQDYLQEFGQEFWYSRFYGLFNGSAVFFITGEEPVISNTVVSGVEFNYNNSWTILVWQDGTFYNLVEDIDAILLGGVLTQEDIVQLGVLHAEANSK